jgi:hypothetical protein
MYFSASSCLPFLYECLLILRLLLGILDGDIFSLVRLENCTDIRGFVNANGCQSPPSVEKSGNSSVELTFEEGYELNKPFVTRFTFPWL